MSDQNIWNYAQLKNLIILTKDSDFYTRCILSNNPVKVVHFQFGNFTINQLHIFFEKNWRSIIEMIDKSTLVVVNELEVQAIL